MPQLRALQTFGFTGKRGFCRQVQSPTETKEPSDEATLTGPRALAVPSARSAAQTGDRSAAAAPTHHAATAHHPSTHHTASPDHAAATRTGRRAAGESFPGFARALQRGTAGVRVRRE